VREHFQDFNFQSATLEVIEQVAGIMGQYRRMGFVLTVRQVYYQLVARGLIENSLSSYKRIVNIVGNARLAGMLDWGLIEDRERPVHYPGHWDGASDIAQSAYHSFRVNRWKYQPWHVEVMCEKKALEGVLRPVCARLDVRFQANRGYSSLTAMYETGKRLERMVAGGKDVAILYFGDHDPSGMDMDRDIAERLSMFSRCRVEVERLALLMDQIEEMDIPENPAKLTDSRADGYIAQYGMSSWELDAMEPQTMADLVEGAILSFRDESIHAEAMDFEEEEKEKLSAFIQDNEDSTY